MAAPAQKTAEKQRGRPFQSGTDARRGGGKKGHSGRKPNTFHDRCTALTDAEVLNEVETILRKGRKDPDWRWAAEYVSKYTKSPAPTKTDVTHDGVVAVVFSHE